MRFQRTSGAAWDDVGDSLVCQAILEGQFPQFRQEFRSRYQPTDEGLRLAQK